MITEKDTLDYKINGLEIYGKSLEKYIMENKLDIKIVPMRNDSIIIYNTIECEVEK